MGLIIVDTKTAVLVGGVVLLGRGGNVKLEVNVGRGVNVKVGVREGTDVCVDVGGVPLTVNRPEFFHSFPTKICTS